MPSYHIHISGLVQGVGFRPLVSRLAEELRIEGWVCNDNDGVHIEITASANSAHRFYRSILKHPPAHAIISSYYITEIPHTDFGSFEIRKSSTEAAPNLLLTPDMAICADCRKEIRAEENRRYQYAFTTCLQCGPRYSIITGLPYDRERTTMESLSMCKTCSSEYQDIHNRRHFSQTNSCPQCAIPMHLYNSDAEKITDDPDCILLMAQQALKEGHIVAVKGIGGYLLLADARNMLTIETLRLRKNRPYKPFAVMYPHLDMAAGDAEIGPDERQALSGEIAPIVLCTLKKENITGICSEVLAPGLSRIGILLPYTPLLVMISENFNAPLIATSGNLSGTPIIYSDDEALLYLTDFADFIISFDRDIVTPQDDSVIQFSRKYRQPIVLRRSRGMAPNYLPHPFKSSARRLAMGADLKSTFALYSNKHSYISQYLGDQAGLESQQGYRITLHHLLQLLCVSPQQVIIDKHPGYSVSDYGNRIAESLGIPVLPQQHHHAHFAAVLAENNLLSSREPVLGVIWDGTGFGDDSHIWGGEFFMYQDLAFKRIAHLHYFRQLLGDKMSREPRLSALSLLAGHREGIAELKELFTDAELGYYQKLPHQDHPLYTSSLGRLLDGIAAILGVKSYNSYEGEAAMLLESLAQSCSGPREWYDMPFRNGQLHWLPMIEKLIEEKNNAADIAKLARKVWVSLALGIRSVANAYPIRKIAFSGGVFQNALLVDLIREALEDEYELFFHRQLSPNDECISFGQLALAEIMEMQGDTIGGKIVQKEELVQS